MRIDIIAVRIKNKPEHGILWMKKESFKNLNGALARKQEEWGDLSITSYAHIFNNGIDKGKIMRHRQIIGNATDLELIKE